MNRRVIAIALVATVALISGLCTPTWSQGDAAGLRIGVVNVKEVFAGYNVAQQFEAGLKAERNAAQAQIVGIEKQMKDLMEEIRILDEGSALRIQKEEELLQLDTLRKYRGERWKAVMQRRINENTARLYNALRAEVDAYAQENGYQLILKTEAPRLEEDSDEGANKRVNSRTVLWCAPELDLTAVILQRLNAK